VSEWFERWFGEEYLDLYPHRDEREAETLVELLASRGIAVAGQDVLDLACGAGRHAAALGRRGARVVGLDLSMPLLLTARHRGAGRLVRADMRSLPLDAARFDAVLNLFTSFGYFASDQEHERVLAEVARVLKPSGHFVLDYLNRSHVAAGLVARDESSAGRKRVVQERSLSEDGRFVTKTIHLVNEGRSFMERVRLYERGDLERMMRHVGLEPEAALGDYRGAPLLPASPRCILLARRP
jgi:SAM-dependent methyltransferase